jgi:hypothetical protein
MRDWPRFYFLYSLASATDIRSATMRGFKLLFLVAVLAVSVLAADDEDETKDKEKVVKEEEEEVVCPKYKCPQQSGSYADPCECRRFYKCDHGVPTRLLCPSGK